MNRLLKKKFTNLTTITFSYNHIKDKHNILSNFYSTKIKPKIIAKDKEFISRNKNLNLTHQDSKNGIQFISHSDEYYNKILQIDNLNNLDYQNANIHLNKNLLSSYLKLSKYRLTSLVLATTLAGYYMGCVNFDFKLVIFTLIGTALTSSSAAALNQFLEIPFDSQMLRTKNRPLVTYKISPLHAFTFAVICGISGISILVTNVNYLTACLGSINLILYSFIYTPMKRINILNTWIGSIVGAIPPIMGYTAATNCIDLGALSLALILYSWQFPHFNALSWNMKHDFARAGYHMMVVTNPDLCVRTAFRHSCLLLIYCELISIYFNITTKEFGFDSLPLNLYFIYLAYQFKKKPDSKTSRSLFKFSLVHLPFLICLMLLNKKDKKTTLN